MTTRKLQVLAIAIAAFAGACSDPAGPLDHALIGGATSALNPIPIPPATPFPDGDGAVLVCKISNTAGTFNFDVAANGPVNGTSDVSITVTAGQVGTRVCAPTPVFTSSAGSSQLEFVNVVELDPGQGWATTVDIDQYYVSVVSYPAGYLSDEFDVAPRTAKVFINNDLEKIIIFNNTFTPTNTGCTYTKGWYQNKNGAPTVTAVDGRTQLEAQTILASQPSPNAKQNLGVTWGSDNLLHNLYQQLLTAILNGGESGPAEVQQAITDAQNGTGGTGLDITTTLTHDEMAALVTILTNFNEGLYAGWPHCGDAVTG